MTNNSIFDYWFKTWPVRIKRKALGTLIVTPQLYELAYKNHIMSLDILSDRAESGNCLLATFASNGWKMDEKQKLESVENNESNLNLSLDTLLDSLPLVYNPSTKRLQVLKLKSKLNDTVESVVSNHINKKYQNKQKILKANKNNSKFAEEETCELISSCTLEESSSGISEITCKKYEFEGSANLECVNNEDKYKGSSVQSRTEVTHKNGGCITSNEKNSPSSAVLSCVKSDGADPKLSTKKKKGITELFTRYII